MGDSQISALMSPAVWRIVDAAGTVHHSHLTAAQADAFLPLMLAAGHFAGIRSERMDAPAIAENTATPPIAAAMMAEAAISKAMMDIEPGAERSALIDALAAHKRASECVDRAADVVRRAKEMHEARQHEVDVLTAARENDIRAGAANLVDALKSGTAVFRSDRPIDSRALLDAETRRDAAREAVDMLDAEHQAADVAHKKAESAVRLAIMAVKRYAVRGMVERLKDIKREYSALAATVEAAKYSDVPATPEASAALQSPAYSGEATTSAAGRWRRYTELLRDNPALELEDVE
ncbi:hypothetical protein [Paraburkholderia sp. MM5477-R1]|uniref:hypothetical protein n=1 Tax=Paraburkholderia sp. MM5477-R1 TaxID=2991062 RepID=UPI003D24D198